jgi:hypothetical protein
MECEDLCANMLSWPCRGDAFNISRRSASGLEFHAEGPITRPFLSLVWWSKVHFLPYFVPFKLLICKPLIFNRSSKQFLAHSCLDRRGSKGLSKTKRHSLSGMHTYACVCIFNLRIIYLQVNQCTHVQPPVPLGDFVCIDDDPSGTFFPQVPSFKHCDDRTSGASRARTEQPSARFSDQTKVLWFKEFLAEMIRRNPKIRCGHV